jgi:phosphoglycolate phosphatase-like HAD superfamily hydrolase
MDISDRYYYVYKYCLERVKKSDRIVRQLTKSEFWQLKRSRVPEQKIGLISGLDETQAQEFARLRHQIAHKLSYLVYDRPHPGAIATLEKLQQLGIDLVVMTMRRTCELEAAFKQHDLGRFFSVDRCYCISDRYVKTGDVKDKPLLMAKALRELPPASDLWMVGDTEADIVAAKTHQVKVIAVLSGIRDRAQLELYQPDYIVNNLEEAASVVSGR